MCMKDVYYNINQYGIGYKVLSLEKNRPQLELSWGYPITVKSRVWYDAKEGCKKFIDSSCGNINKTLSRYPAGFHIFADVEDAKKYLSYIDGEAIYKVYFRNVVSVGTNKNRAGDYGLCFIARQIKLVKRITDENS